MKVHLVFCFILTAQLSFSNVFNVNQLKADDIEKIYSHEQGYYLIMLKKNNASDNKLINRDFFFGNGEIFFHFPTFKGTGAFDNYSKRTPTKASPEHNPDIAEFFTTRGASSGRARMSLRSNELFVFRGTTPFFLPTKQGPQFQNAQYISFLETSENFLSNFKKNIHTKIFLPQDDIGGGIEGFNVIARVWKVDRGLDEYIAYAKTKKGNYKFFHIKNSMIVGKEKSVKEAEISFNENDIAEFNEAEMNNGSYFRYMTRIGNPKKKTFHFSLRNGSLLRGSEVTWSISEIDTFSLSEQQIRARATILRALFKELKGVSIDVPFMSPTNIIPISGSSNQKIIKGTQATMRGIYLSEKNKCQSPLRKTK